MMTRLRGLRIRLRAWRDRHATAIAFGLLSSVAAGSVAGILVEADRRTEAVCEAIVDNRDGLSRLIDVVLEDPAGLPRLDLLPAYEHLDEPTKRFVDELVDASTPDEDEPGLAERLEAYRDGLAATPC